MKANSLTKNIITRCHQGDVSSTSMCMVSLIQWKKKVLIINEAEICYHSWVFWCWLCSGNWFIFLMKIKLTDFLSRCGPWAVWVDHSQAGCRRPQQPSGGRIRPPHVHHGQDKHCYQVRVHSATHFKTKQPFTQSVAESQFRVWILQSACPSFDEGSFKCCTICLPSNQMGLHRFSCFTAVLLMLLCYPWTTSQILYLYL